MPISTIILIVVVVVVAIVLIAALTWMVRTRRNHQRHVEAGKIREQAREETLHVRQREALADETAARARAAQAEADVKSAQASGLKQQAEAHRGEAATSRDELNQQFARADDLDPRSQDEEESETRDTPRGAAAAAPGVSPRQHRDG